MNTKKVKLGKEGLGMTCDSLASHPGQRQYKTPSSLD